MIPRVHPELAHEARRLLDRYLIEAVEAFGLCPWAASARRRGEVRVEIVDLDDADAAVDRIADDHTAAIGMVVFANHDLSVTALRRGRDAQLARRRDVAIADFHPDAVADLSSPARLVPFLRRSPDPMLQVVRHQVLADARRAAAPPDRAVQAAMLAGHAAPAPPPLSDQIARNNLATVVAGGGALAAVLDYIRRDREATYSRLTRGSRPAAGR